MTKTDTKTKLKLKLAGFPGILLAMYPLMYAVISRRRDVREYSAVDVSAMVFIFYSILAFFVGMREFFNHRHTEFKDIVFRSNPVWFMIFSIWGLLSIFWTVNIPLTGYRAFECIALFWLIIAVISKLVKQYGVDTAIHWVLKWLVLFDLLISIIRRISWADGIMEILQASQMGITVFFYLVWFHGRSKIIKIITALFSIFSGSTTAYIGMALGSVGLWFGQKKQRRWAFAICLIALCGIFILGPRGFFKKTVFNRRKDISIEDTTGRNHIWEVTWRRGNQKPLTGWGFFAAEPYLLYQSNLGSINCHNSFMSAFLGTGYIGAALLLIYVLSFVPILFSKKLLGEYRSSLICCYLAAVCQCMGNPGIGSRVFGSWKPVTILLVLISVIAFYRKKEGKNNKEVIES